MLFRSRSEGGGARSEGSGARSEGSGARSEGSGARSEENIMIKYMHFLSSSIVLFLFDTTRYRMRYLEKYAFEFIPNIVSYLTLEQLKDDSFLCRYFDLTPEVTSFILTRYPRYPKVFSPQYVM